MAYNNGFPLSYQYYQPVISQAQTQQAQAPQTNNNFIWVQGEAGAKSYLVAPNQTVTLWDSEAHTIYLKSADAVGMPTMKILDYTFRDVPQTAQVSAQSDFATRDDVESIRKELNALRAKFEERKGEKK